VIASTATIRNAGDQVFKLFLRRVNVFPPHGLDIRDNFFSLQREPSEEHPGRRYIGICAPGRRLKAALIRVYVAFLSAAQSLFKYVRAGCRRLDDAGRLLQLDARARRDAAPGG
jgi:hypothetical protein